MAESYKELGNVSPAANTNTLLYQCPADTEAIVTTFTAGNTNATAVTFGFAVVDGVASDLDADDWVVYGAPLSANNGFTSHNITLSAGFSLVVRASATLVNFHAFGVEVEATVSSGVAASTTVASETTFGISSSPGTAGSGYSLGNHTHGTPAAPSIPSASSTVTSQTSFGASSSAGTAATFSKGDHSHGTPANPISQQTFIADPSGGTVQDSEARTAIASILDALIANGIIASS